MVNKKGFLLLEKNVVELVLAVVGLLLVLGVVIYGFSLLGASQDVRNAKTALTILETRANSLNDGENIVAPVKGPCKDTNCDWFIAGWSKTDITAPESCLLENCICICKGLSNLYVSGISNACSKSDLCREIKNVDSLKMLSGYNEDKVQGVGTQGQVSMKQVNYPIIPLSANLVNVNISKENGEITFKKI